MPSSLRSAFVSLPAVALAIAGLFACAPAEARAGCGDYVVYMNPAHGKVPADHTPAPARCHGPNCSQAPPPAPMPQAPPSVRILPDQSLPLTGANSETPPGSSLSAIGSADGSPIRRATDVFHPPR